MKKDEKDQKKKKIKINQNLLNNFYQKKTFFK